MKTEKKLIQTLSALLLVTSMGQGCFKQEVKATETNPKPPKVEKSQPTKPATESKPAQQLDDAPNATNAPNPSNLPETNSTKNQGKTPKERIFEDFTEYQKKALNGDTSLYTYYMLADRHTGLEALKWDGTSVADFYQQYRAQVNNALARSPVFFTYTVDGLHFVATGYPLVGEKVHDELVNKVRGLEDETHFLRELGLYQQNERLDSTFLVMDVFVEDLFHPDAQTIPIDDIEVASSDDAYAPKYGDRALQVPNQPGLDQILKKYNRTLGDPRQLKNKSWNVMLFDVHAALVMSSGSLVIQRGGDYYGFINHW